MLPSLEDEAIEIIREVIAQFKNPVVLYSAGKDSSVLLHLACKAVYPSVLTIPMLHVDTGYKPKEIYEYRDVAAKKYSIQLLVYKNDNTNIHPTLVGINACCRELKTNALLSALSKYNFDAALGGARREEEKSRAKERIFSFRGTHNYWDVREQRPEIWNIYNGRIHPEESMRVFPLSNWTEIDVWQYIKKENIEVNPLYFAQLRRVVVVNNILIPSPKGSEVMCRYRTLGCLPCSGLIKSEATTINSVIEELTNTRQSERASRLIDYDQDSSMEIKKKEGYF